MKDELTPRGWGQEQLEGMKEPTTAPSLSSNTQALGSFTVLAFGIF